MVIRIIEFYNVVNEENFYIVSNEEKRRGFIIISFRFSIVFNIIENTYRRNLKNIKIFNII